MVDRVGDVDVAGRVRGDAAAVVQGGLGRGAAVAAEAHQAVAGDGRDGAARRDLADTVVDAVVPDVDVAAAVDGDVVGVVDLGRRRRPAVAREAGAAPCRGPR